MTSLNIRGARHSSDFQNWTNFIKVGAILFVGGALLMPRRQPVFAGGFWPEHWSGSPLSRLGVAMIAVLWAYEGWQFPAYTAGETLEAQRNFPRDLLAGTLCLIAIYLFANTGCLAALGPARAAEGLVIILAGVPAYFFWHMRGKPAVAPEGKERQTPG